VGSSWLSREILFGVLFAILGGLFAIMQWRKWGSFTRRNVVATLAGIAGLFLVISMSGVYMLPTQPAWNTLATPIFFLTTTLLLGSLAMGAAFAANYLYLKRKERDGLDIQLDLLRGSLRGISATALVVLGIQLIVSPLYIAALSAGVPEAQESASMLVNDYVTIFVLRLVLSLVGAGLFAIVLYQSAGGEAKDKTMAYLVYGAFGLVLVAEVLGRYLFYAIQVPVGI
jgi:anaerobic dimethyl sulfoxide reductase subunit C (anchor subunit)